MYCTDSFWFLGTINKKWMLRHFEMFFQNIMHGLFSRNFWSHILLFCDGNQQIAETIWKKLCVSFNIYLQWAYKYKM